MGKGLTGRHGADTWPIHGVNVSRRDATWCTLVAMAAAGCGASTPTDPVEGRGGVAPARVVMISVDGLMPDCYVAPDAHGLAVPTLRRMAAQGAFATRVESVFPTVTYPAHTTLVTGAPPAVHGITTNRTLDGLDKNQGGWRWYSEDIAVPTLWQAVEAAGRPAAVVTWPVTVGAAVRFSVPEYWRAGTPDDQKLLRALSTPGLLEAVAAHHPTLWSELTPPDVRDAAQFAIARHLLVEEDPELVLVHVWQTDDAQHNHGPWSREAVAAIEHVDTLLGELVAALEQTPAWSRTAVVVVSDHGFAAQARELRLNVLFAEHGLAVTTSANGGTAYVYADAAAAAAIEAALATLGPAVDRIYRHDELVALGGDPRATFAVAAAPGFGFSDARQGPAVVPSSVKGTHGWPPSDPAMASSFVAFGPRIAHRELGVIPMVDIAPTLAAWLQVRLRGATGTPLEELVK